MSRRLSTLLAAGLMAAGVGAQQYEISGTAPEGSTLYFQNMEAPVLDSTVVVNGRFSFKGDAAGEPYALITFKEGAGYTSMPVYLDGKITVDVSGRKVKGSEENKGLSRDYKRVRALAAEAEKLMKDRANLKGQGEGLAARKEEYEKAINKAFEDLGSTLNLICRKNIRSMYPAALLCMYFQYMKQEDIVALYDVGPVYKDTNLAGHVFERVEGWRRQMARASVADLVMADTAGVERHLTDFVGKGKYVLVDFWASWCGPCRAEMPALKAVYDKYRAKGFDIVGISFDDNKAAWTAAIRKLDLSWHHISDLKNNDSSAQTVYRISSIPFTLLFGPDGKVIASGLRGEAVAGKLEEVLK